MIPVADDNPSRGIPWVTISLIVACFLVFLFWQPIFQGTATQDTFFFCQRRSRTR